MNPKSLKKKLGPEDANPNETAWNVILLVIGMGTLLVLAIAVTLKSLLS